MDIVIEKGVPMPVSDDRKVKLDALEIGDSFGFQLANRASMASLISSEFHSLTNKRFKISVKGQPKFMARVWRIEDQIEEN